MEYMMERHKDLYKAGTAVLADSAISPTDTSFYGYLRQELDGVVDMDRLTTSLNDQPLDKASNRIAKRALDIVLSLVVIVCVLSWLTPILAILIWLDSPGPIFFSQRRNKRNGEVFNCLKFRSMVVNNQADILPATENDPRITKLGRFLRRYYIDELPQFFNVFWGDMSVVGPRPHMISDNLRFGEQLDYYYYRHKVKPGITGLAQVMGYVGNVGEHPHKIRDRVRLDIFYWRHWSFKLDWVILVRTLTRVGPQ
jgi:putative colanic acid biosysnthesis UDP-glucose lipid carrier transferase